MGISSTWQGLAGLKCVDGDPRSSLIKDCSAMLLLAKQIILPSHSCQQMISCHPNHIGWALHHVDFIMAYPQASIKCNMFMELPQGIQVSGF
jgi:hypothetical protein